MGCILLSVMPFGLKNVKATYQRMAMSILHEMKIFFDKNVHTWKSFLFMSSISIVYVKIFVTSS